MSKSGFPLFYASAVPLSSNAHVSWGLLPGDAGFAAEAAASPVTAGEFAAAGRFYPVLFAANTALPIALMGLENANLFVRDGQWTEGTYVPAYVRRYPFLLIEAGDKSGYALGIDGSSAQVTKGGRKGKALFEDGAPSDVTKAALEFCRLFNEDHQRTQAFCNALDQAGILVDRRADAALPDGRRMGVEGFKVVDVAQFMALDDATVVEWHKRGWLALVHYHLASLERFSDLLNRQGKKLGATPASSVAASEAPAGEDVVTTH
ncbi:MAG TPA: SapC family protein [Rhizomicrobium sp.]|nr:SapC family protein [Rhizomicrobium sp.]